MVFPILSFLSLSIVYFITYLILKILCLNWIMFYFCSCMLFYIFKWSLIFQWHKYLILSLIFKLILMLFFSVILLFGFYIVSVCLQCRRPGFNHWVWNFPWRRKWQPTPVLLPGKFHGRRSLVGYSPWDHKELDMTEWLRFHFSFLFGTSLLFHVQF